MPQQSAPYSATEALSWAELQDFVLSPDKQNGILSRCQRGLSGKLTRPEDLEA